MRNVDLKVDGSKLTITVDLDARHGLSSSGKSATIASSDGNMAVPGFPEIKLGLNVYTAAKK